VILVARNKSRVDELVQKLIKETENKHITYLMADVSRKEQVANIADKLDGPIDTLINNAAVTPRQREETPEGIEMQFATNVLGYFWMIRYFLPHLKKATSSRIVNVASYWAGNLELNDLEFKTRNYNNDMAYRQSKQADRMLTVAFANKLLDDGITVNACHPGDVRSTLASNLGYGGHESPEQGATTPVWLATSEDIAQKTGKYFEHLKETHCQFSSNTTAIKELFEICSSY
jgi:retinol dehydrogenase-13